MDFVDEGTLLAVFRFRTTFWRVRAVQTPSSTPPTRSGTPGLDVFKIAGRSISGFLPSFKTSNDHQVRMPYTSTLELKLALYLEYHAHVRHYQRGDMSVAFANAYHICTPL